MKIFKNMKIGQKVGIGFSIILGMMAIILALNIVSNVITYSSTVQVRDASNIGNLFNQLNMQYSEARLWANAIYIEDSDEFPGYFEEAAQKVEASFDELLEYIVNCRGLGEYEGYVLDLRETFRNWKLEVNNSELFYGAARESTAALTNAGVNLTTKVEDLFRGQLLVLKDESTDQELFQNHVEASQVFNNRSTMIQQLYENTAKITAFRRLASSSIANFNAEEAENIAKEISGSHISIRTFKNLYGSDPSLDGLDEAVDLVGEYRVAYLDFAQIMQDLQEHIKIAEQDGEIVKAEVSNLAREMNELLEIELNVVNTIMIGALLIVAAVSVFSIVFGIYIARFLVANIKKPIEVMSTTLLNLGHDGKIDLSEEEMNVIKEVSKGKDEIAIAIRTLILTMERLQYVGHVLETVANGNLQIDVELLSLEDSMGKSLDLMVNKLDKIFTEITKSANEVAGATFQISDGAQELAQGSTEQAATVEELTTSMETISKETMENDSRAQEAAKMSKQILSDAAKGNSQMKEMLKAVNEINEASNNISIVIKTIDDIAFQTDILALNAAVEAARAGEAGKGFAVVAQEVRNLAIKSASAAKETDALIQNSIEKAELGATIASDTAKSLGDIVSSIEISADIISKISKSSRIQANSITEINKGIERVSDVVHRNSSTAEESAASSEEMSTQAVYLKENVSQFKLKQELLF